MSEVSAGPASRLLRRITAGKWRVAWGYAGAVVLLLLADPLPATIVAGLPFVVLGEAVRVVANGSLVKDKRFTDWGIYAHIRHPLYAGSTLIGLGFLIMAYSAIVALLFILFYPLLYGRAVKREERKMEELYGERYREWSRKVPRFFPRRLSFSEVFEHVRLERAWANREQQGVLGVTAMTAVLYLRYLFFS